MEIGWIMGGIIFISILVYGVVALLFPEIVGIQGKRAKEIEESHRRGAVSNGDSTTEKNQ